MRSYDDALAAARDGSPFSNHTQWEIWSARWCEECCNDSPELVDAGKGCPLITVALMEKTPAEWTAKTEQDEVMANFECSEFVQRPEWPGDDDPDDGPPPDPGPPPVVEGQVDMFEVFAEQIVDQVESAVPAS